jgi:hypothetical protein
MGRVIFIHSTTLVFKSGRESQRNRTDDSFYIKSSAHGWCNPARPAHPQSLCTPQY